MACLTGIFGSCRSTGWAPPLPSLRGGRRPYTPAQIGELRTYLAGARPKEALSFLPTRRPGDKLQIVAVANFKGGSAKTTTALYLTQFLALEGYRVLAIDLDPQASLSAMFGYQPEFDIGEGETLYGAIRYDDARRPMREVVRPTYFTGVSLIPGNLELMEFEHHTPRAMVERSLRGSDLVLPTRRERYCGGRGRFRHCGDRLPAAARLPHHGGA